MPLKIRNLEWNALGDPNSLNMSSFPCYFSFRAGRAQIDCIPSLKPALDQLWTVIDQSNVKYTGMQENRFFPN